MRPAIYGYMRVVFDGELDDEIEHIALKEDER